MAERRGRLDLCDIGGATAGVEKVGQPLMVDLLGASEPITIKPGGAAAFRVYGGKPPYRPELANDPAGSGPKVAMGSGGAGVVNIATTADTAPGDYRVVVADESSQPARSVAVKVEKGEKVKASQARRK